MNLRCRLLFEDRGFCNRIYESSHCYYSLHHTSHPVFLNVMCYFIFRRRSSAFAISRFRLCHKFRSDRRLPMNGQGWRLIPSLVNRCLTQTSPRYLSVRNSSIPFYKSLHTATVMMAHNLPNLVKPTHYDVTLYNFDFEKFTFSGDVSIRYP